MFALRPTTDAGARRAQPAVDDYASLINHQMTAPRATPDCRLGQDADDCRWRIVGASPWAVRSSAWLPAIGRIGNGRLSAPYPPTSNLCCNLASQRHLNHLSNLETIHRHCPHRQAPAPKTDRLGATILSSAPSWRSCFSAQPAPNRTDNIVATANPSSRIMAMRSREMANNNRPPVYDWEPDWLFTFSPFETA